MDLEWDKVTDEDLAGYVLYYGEESSLYYFSIDNGTANTVRVKNLRPSKTYYFVVKAYDKSGYLSGPSNEVETSMAKSARSSYFWIIYIIAALLCASIGTLIWYKKKEKNASAKLA